MSAPPDPAVSLADTLASLQEKAEALSAQVARQQQLEAAVRSRDQELSDFMENAAVGLHRVGPEGEILWANRFELDLFGYTAEEYIGKPITAFHANFDVIESIKRRLIAGETLIAEPSTIRCKDGSLKEVLIHSSALMEDGKFVSTRCFTHDVTEKVRLERELKTRLAELDDLDRRKDEFLAMLGHELRNPLAPIMSALALMRAHPGNAELTVRACDVMRRQANLMHRLVNDLLDVSRITQGKIELQLSDTTVADVLAAAVELAQPYLDERAVALSVEQPQGTVPVRVDAERLVQAIANLLHNAAKFSEAGGKVALHASVQGDVLLLEVRDQGIGLDCAMKTRIFDIFVQEKSQLAQVRGGLGLGLTLVRRIAQLHGGTAEAESAGRGQGCEFVLKLPVIAMAENSSQTDIEGADPFPSMATQATARKVLVVDDNRDAAELLGEIMQVYGHEVTLAYSGAEALALAESLQPDVAILDIGMPDMDGYETCRRLRSLPGLDRAMCIALTGYTQKEDRALALDAGFNHHLAKPVDFDKLNALLQA
ncbi:MAG TPA: response regulator [Burkholderiaceae bacterium]